MKTASYKDLIAYQKAYRLTLDLYRATRHFPTSEKYCLTSQLRRSAVSIPSNIAEGYRRGRREYLQFLKVAFGSCAELETQISLSKDLDYLDEATFVQLYTLQEEVSRLLSKMVRSMEGST